jgi:hypothetical protein
VFALRKELKRGKRSKKDKESRNKSIMDERIYEGNDGRKQTKKEESERERKKERRP